jgi:hypothetical protein
LKIYQNMGQKLGNNTGHLMRMPLVETNHLFISAIQSDAISRS